MKVHNKILKAFGALLIAALLFAVMPAGEVKAQTPITVCASGCDHTTIQDAITAASDGDTINVAPGTYDENIIINKSNITLQSIGTADETIINADEGFGVYILKDLGTVTIDGFTVKGWLTTGIVQGTANREGTTSHILNNIVVGEAGDENHGNCIQVTGDNSLVEGNTVTGAYYIGSGPYGASGILVYAANNAIVRNNIVSGADIGISVTAGAYHSLGSITDVVVEGNEVSGSEIGIGVTFDANNTTITKNNIHDNLTGLFEEFYLGYGPTGTEATFNKIVDNEEQAAVGSSDETVIPEDHSFFASPNWWGSAAGPAAGTVVGDVKVNPWCYNEACTELYVAEGGLIQDAIDAADPGDTIMVGPGTHQEANIVIEKDNITLQSTDGAENTIIDATGTTRNGILVQNATGVTIDGFTIESWGQVEETGSTRNRRAIVAGENVSSITIKNNIVEYNELQNRQSNGIVSEMNNGPIVIEGNQISGIKYTMGGTEPEEWQGTGIGIWGAKNVTIDGNTIDDVELAIGIYGFDTIETADVTIQNNTVTNSGQAHIHLNHDWGEGIDESNINILGNTFGGVLEYNFEVQNRPSGDAEVDLDGVLANNTFDNAVVIVGGSQIYSSIQTAIDDASDGDTIHVYPGTYEEALKDGVSGSKTYQVALLLNKPNITVKSVGTAEETIIDVPYTGELTTGVFVEANMGIVTFDGFTVQNFGETGIVQGSANAAGTTFHVLNNIVEPKSDYLRNGIQVSGDGSTVFGNTVIGAPLTEDWASSGIMVVNASNVLVEGNTVTGEKYGLDRGIFVQNYGDVSQVSGVEIRNNNVDFCTSAIYVDGRKGKVTGTLVTSNIVGAEAKYGVYINDALNTEITDNDILAYYMGIAHSKATATGTKAEYNRVVNNDYPIYAWDEVAIDASPNWWGSINGPSPILNTLIEYAPWCGDAECSFLVSPLEGEITNTVQITGDDTHYLLKDGTTINTGGACFDITASNVTITAENAGGAVCYPGSPGITVADGATNVVIEGLEIDGQGTAVGHGIDFLGAVADVIISDNYIHGMDGDGVNFAAAPGDYVEITGNLFKDNSGVGVEAPADLDVSYNAWGDYGGPTTGDGVSTNIISYSPWTHVDVEVVYLTDSARYANEVAYGEATAEEITYEVYANLQEAYGAEFTLSFDPAKLQVASTDTSGTVFPSEWTSGSTETVTPGVTVDNVTGKITFAGGAINAVSGEDQFLFSVTFTGTATTDVANPLSFDEEDEDLFGMNPGYGASLNIYADELVGVEDVNVYDLPTLAIDPLANYAVGNPKEFTLTVTNPATGRAYTDLNVDLDVPTGATLEYWDGGAWVAYVDGVDIGALAVDAAADVLFRITFVTAGDNDITVTLNDGTIFLVVDTFTFTVLESYTVTGTVQMQGRTTRSGVLVALIHESLSEYGYDTLSTNVITHNYTLDNLAEGSYGISITHDRYLDFTTTGFNLTADALDLTRLELRGGDVEKDNEIDIFDASLVGTNYGNAGDDDADANFDGRVNIQDLAMIGGNFDLTSATAYAGYTP